MMKPHDLYSGFEVIRIRELKENTVLYELEHKKTGAGVCWLQTKDRNKTFSVSFQTVPFDDTGVFHILEHSVLNGSEKFPVKDPFVELMKGSLQTFLNAITFPDKTVYPFSSRNEKDFMNLLEVYMDAVFCPRIYTEPRIFEKEGWHYEFENAEEVPEYNGVVFNEMKGAFSSVDETIGDEMNRLLFPDGPYRFVSGGDPAKIPDLTYEKFLETHRKFYHPSNAKIYMEGDLDAENVLEFIDREYFSRYEKEEICWSTESKDDRIIPFSRVEHPLNEDEDPKSNAYLAFGKKIGTYDEILKIYALTLASASMVESNDAPLMKMILENGLGKDAEFQVVDEIREPYLMAVIRNMDPSKFDEAKEKFFGLMKEIAEKGLPREKIRSMIDRLEFRSREVKEPAGLIHARGVLRSWLYGGDPALYLSSGNLFDSLREKLEEGYFEKCLGECFEDPSSVSVAETVSSFTREKEIADAEKERLLKEFGAMSRREREDYVRKNAELAEFTDRRDTPEDLAKLPHLTREDISPEPLYYPAEETSYEGVPVRLYAEESEDIRYVNFYFDMTGLKTEDLAYLAVMRGLYGNLPTKNHDVTELRGLIQSLTGSFSTGTVVSGMDGNPGKTKIRLQVSFSSLFRNEAKAEELLYEILKDTVWDKEKIRTRLDQLAENYKIGLTESGDAFAASRIAASSSSGGRANEELQGLSFYRRLTGFLKDYDRFYEELLKFTERVKSEFFVRQGLSVSASGKEVPAMVKTFVNRFPEGRFPPEYTCYPLLDLQAEGLRISSGVSYLAAGGNLKSAGFEYRASYQVCAQILSLGYLWNRIRDVGGAYGTGCSLSSSGNLVVWTYRDPDPGNSYREALSSGKFLSEWDEEILPYIIGSIANTEPVLSPPQKIVLSDYQAFENTTYDKLKEERVRLLNTSAEDVRKFAEIMQKVLAMGKISVFGPQDAFIPFEEQAIMIQTLGGEKI